MENEENEASGAVGALSIAQFCALHGISRTHFYTLKKDKLAPKVMKVGGRRLISNVAAIKWRRKMEQLNIEQ